MGRAGWWGRPKLKGKGMWELSNQFCCEPTTVLKNSVDTSTWMNLENIVT